MLFVRMFVFGFLALSVFYILLVIWFRSMHREGLEKAWDGGEAVPLDGEGRDAYIERGMKGFGRSLHVRLLWLVYIFPLAALAVIVYFVNYA